MRKIGVYQILNTVTGRCYVGSTVDIRRRWIEHRTNLNCHRHHTIGLQRAWDKYGQAAFAFSILELTAPGDLLAREQHWIDALKAYGRGYNGRPLATSNLGHPTSDETRRKIGEAHRAAGHRPAREAIELARQKNLGRSLSPEHRAKMSAAHRGRVDRPEWRAAAIAANTGAKRSPEARARMREARLRYLAQQA